MGRRFKLKLLLGLFKDEASIIKVTFSTKRRTASIRLAVIRATTRASTSPPSELQIDAILAHGHSNRPTASACIHALMNRLHKTRNVYIVFKCLIVLHNIIARGSFILKDQLAIYPSTGGRNFLNLSMFYDKTNVETWEFSSWVRWYASFLELNLMTSRVLGSNLSSSHTSINNVKDSENLSALLNLDLIKEIKALVDMVEEICRAPEGSINQANNFVYLVIRLVGEDYRSIQQKIYARLTELGDRVSELNSGELEELVICMRKVEETKERLVALFVNRKRNDAFWELIGQTKNNFVRIKKERESVLAICESTQLDKRAGPPGQLVMRLLPYGGRWFKAAESTRLVSLPLQRYERD